VLKISTVEGREITLAHHGGIRSNIMDLMPLYFFDLELKVSGNTNIKYRRTT